MLGNSALSPSHILNHPTGSPVFLNGYSDSVIGLASAIIMLFILIKLSRFNIKFLNVKIF